MQGPVAHPPQKGVAAAAAGAGSLGSSPSRSFGAPPIRPPPEDDHGDMQPRRMSSRSRTAERPNSAAYAAPHRAPSPPTRHIPLSPLPKTERPKDASGLLPLAAMKSQSARRAAGDPVEQEQALFEQRLCEDNLGVAVRKINQYGKANLRYVKCVNLDEYEARNSGRSISSRSVGSWGRRRSPGSRENITPNDTEKSKRALVWGKKKDVYVSLDKFTTVRKGKTTERARRNPSPSSRVLSILTKDPNHPSLDIEAPTRMDRDKFARAFARFLEIPLVSEDSPSVNSADITPATFKTTPDPSASSSAAGDVVMPERETVEIPPSGKPPQNPKKVAAVDQGQGETSSTGGFWQGAVVATSAAANLKDMSHNSDHPSSVNVDSSSRPAGESSQEGEDEERGPEAILELKANDPVSQTEEGSVVSSLTGHGYDQELVEELHQALNDLRAELEESRAEASRAVKVAEQAIQSAERSSSAEWQNTVTHKAAEAAAIAQKRSAEAIAKQRLAEEKLEGERRTAAFWRKQAEIAESEAGHLQTRAASAEVQRATFEEQIESERRLAASRMEAMKDRMETLHSQQLASMNETMERNRTLEIELQSLRRELQARRHHVEDVENVNDGHGKQGKRRMKFGGRKKNISEAAGATEAKALLLASGTESSSESAGDRINLPSSEVARLQAQADVIRNQYEMLRKTTKAELDALPTASKAWTQQVTQTLGSSQDEIARLRRRLAVEIASRRKLLHEVQDLRGVVRVYCRPRPCDESDRVISMPSQETLVLHREKISSDSEGCGPVSYEFDRIFDDQASQRDVFMEIQDVLLSALEGYKVCMMAYGQTGTGKTKTLLGDVQTNKGKLGIENHGVQLQAIKQLLSIAKQRSEKFKDTFTLTIVEVHNERVSDLLVGTQAAVARGQLVVAETKRKSQRSVEDDTSSSKPAKLEIRTDLHGETIVQGSVSLEIESFEEALEIWEEALVNRRNRLIEQEADVANYESSAHVIATLQITSANIATGHGTVGKLQFVDLAGADLAKRNSKESISLSNGNSDDANLLLVHRSLETLEEVALARSQFVRSVPYRNSTLTHLLRDSLEADTKVLLFSCISTDAGNLQATKQALRFAHTMRQVNVGKATKHIISSP